MEKFGWNSSTYLKFKEERTQPSRDLAAAIKLEAPKRIVDIGCGPGNSTAVLKAKYPEAEVIGVDNSENMLEKARVNHPDITFVYCDVSKGFEGVEELEGGFDVVFSNACIQWVPDHHKLIPNMLGLLKKGGVMAVQVPLTERQPMHKALGDIAKLGKWQGRFPDLGSYHTLSAEEYYDILTEHADYFRMWETTYYHRLNGCEDVIEWYRGSALRPYLQRLDEVEQKEFEAKLLEMIKDSYHVQKNGEIIFRFPRLFFTASV
ncbi:methyltransferase domain-containing protein [Ruminococcus sp.]|uniref:methyltransferase domain-containing protein n=1 Tax=Ruminococcus sp. TaxID=41978 RepID=UPI003AB55353